MTKQSDTKTIHEFLAENPNVDVSKQWERCWNIHGKIADRITKYFDAKLHPISEDSEYYTSPDGQMEASFFGYTGNDTDWFVRSWLGNRKGIPDPTRKRLFGATGNGFPADNTRAPLSEDS